MRKITNEEARDIRRGYNAGKTMNELAKEFGVAQSTISRRINRVTRDIPIPPQQKNKGLRCFLDRVVSEKVNKGRNYRDYVSIEKKRQEKGRIV